MLPPDRSRQRTLVLVAACCWLSGWATAAESRFGQTYNPSGPMKEVVYGLLVSEPETRVVAPGKMRVRFRTKTPTPPAKLYYGINDITEKLDYPRYRLEVNEPGRFDEPRVYHQIEIPFDEVLKLMPNTQFEPRICWRVEVYLPAKRSSRMFEGRGYFDPQTLGDTVNVLYGPVVEQVGPDAATIVLETDRPCQAGVRVEDRWFRSERPSQRHAIRVGELRPNTRYEYHVEAGPTKIRPYAFKTSGSGSFCFAAMVDSREGVGGGMRNFAGVNGFSLYALASGAYFRGADFIIFPGDLINGYTTSVADFRLQLNAFRQMFAPVHAWVPIYEGMGNHESLMDVWQHGEQEVRTDKLGRNSAESVFASLFDNPRNGPSPEVQGAPTYSENVYYFDYGPARVFMLNNNYWYSDHPAVVGGNLEGYVMPRQMRWLRQEVVRADRDDNIKLLFFAAQEPPFPNGGHTKDSMWYYGGDTNNDQKVDEQDIKILENRNEMWEIVASSPKTVAFITGDEHAYSRLMVRPDTDIGSRRKMDGSQVNFKHAVWQITSGGAGAPWYDKELKLPWSGELRRHSTQPHYAFFRIDGGEVRLEAYSQTGEQLDIAMLRGNGANLTGALSPADTKP